MVDILGPEVKNQPSPDKRNTGHSLHIERGPHGLRSIIYLTALRPLAQQVTVLQRERQLLQQRPSSAPRSVRSANRTG